MVHYQTGPTWNREALSLFQGFCPFEVQIQEFSLYVPDALDAFKLVAPEVPIVLQGVLNSPQFTASFGWLTTKRTEDWKLLMAFEAFLLEEGVGSKVIRSGRIQAPD